MLYNRAMQGQIKQKNPEIEFWRFFFAVVVFLSHISVLPYGALAVDFFFLLTGYLTMASIQNAASKNISKSAFAFIIHKIKSFYPELLAATFVSIAIALYSQCIDLMVLAQAFKTLVNGMIPFLKMSGIGISVTDYNGATWYLSSMIIGLLVVYPLLVRYRGHALLLVAGVLICGFLCVYHGALNGVYDFIYITYEGNIRAIGELLVGSSIYPLVQYLKNHRLTLFCSALLSLLKICCIGVIVFISTRHNSSYHGIALCAAILALILIFSEHGIDKNLFNNKLCLFLGALSLPLYLAHRTITIFANSLLPESVISLWQKTCICFTYSLLAALLVMWLGRLIRKNSANILRLFVKD